MASSTALAKRKEASLVVAQDADELFQTLIEKYGFKERSMLIAEGGNETPAETGDETSGETGDPQELPEWEELRSELAHDESPEVSDEEAAQLGGRICRSRGGGRRRGRGIPASCAALALGRLRCRARARRGLCTRDRLCSHARLCSRARLCTRARLCSRAFVRASALLCSPLR